MHGPSSTLARVSDVARARIERIRAALSALDPSALQITDESHLHRGHAGARGGAGHFRVRVVSAVFSGRPRVARHRLVYDALADEMGGEIHALALVTLTPDEARAADA